MSQNICCWSSMDLFHDVFRSQETRRAADQKVTFGEIASPDDVIEALDAVTEDEVRRIAADISGHPVVACVGPHEVADFD